MSSRRSTVVWISCVASIAAFFRFYRLHTLPLGLHHDEAMNGTDALLALITRHFSVFYPANFGREGLLINLQAISISLFGATPWALRAVTASFGVLTCVGLFFLVRDLYDERHAIVAAILQAVLVWPVVTSRLGLRAQLSVTVLVWMLFFLMRALQITKSADKKYYLALAGIVLGLGFYTYIAYRIVPLLAVVVALLAMANGSRNVTRRLLIVTLFAVLTALPLILYFVQHPSAFTSRTSQVLLEAEGRNKVSGFFYILGKELQMPFWRGDLNPRHNVCREPVVPLLVLPFFLIGVSLLVRPFLNRATNAIKNNWRAWLLIAWALICSLPDLLSEPYEQPHGLRLILLQPIFPIVIAIGFVRVQEWLKHRSLHKFITALPLVLLVATVIYEFDLVFRRWEESPYMKHAFAYSTLPLVDSLETTQSAKPRYIVGPWYDSLSHGIPNTAQTIAYLTQTVTPEAQEKKNIHYILQHALDAHAIGTDTVELIPVPDPGD